jgi:hypothetical protein
MKAFGIASLCCAALTMTAMDDASAGGRSGGSGRGFSGHAAGHSHFAGHRGAHFHSRVFIGGAFVAAPLFYYPPPYYYAPAPAYYYPPPQPVYMEPAPVAPPQQYWYFCPSSRSYYPYAKACPDGWQRVLPNPQSPPAG